MQITNDVRQAIAAATATAPASNNTSAAANSVSGLANEQTFLQLLVAQIQNQDPMSPTDSMDFVTQLAQFSSLEQLIGINQGVTTLNTDLSSSTTTPPSSSTGTNPATGQ